jgi:glycine/D-amino acid oxidase-like deaminating enzyme
VGAAAFSPHVARVHPAKLLAGLAATVEQLGASIYEATSVSEIRPHEARTQAGAVRARWIVRATEAYTARLPGLRRKRSPGFRRRLCATASSASRRVGEGRLRPLMCGK